MHEDYNISRQDFTINHAANTGPVKQSFPSPLGILLREMGEVTGCSEFKDVIRSIICDHRMREIQRKRGIHTAKHCYHMAFTGNPGCNKTSMARLAAKILAAAKITNRDSFAEVSRTDLVSEYQGHTAIKVRTLFQTYSGGVIFIDEAYSLNDHSNTSSTYGEEAINEILVQLENMRNTVVIFAGYPAEMDKFLKSNPGLRSRIPYTVNFPDYTADELLSITEKIAEINGFTITKETLAKLRPWYENMRLAEHFANGRFVRNAVERAVTRKSVKIGLMKAHSITPYLDSQQWPDEVIFSLDADCFNTEKETDLKTAKDKRIGFIG